MCKEAQIVICKCGFVVAFYEVPFCYRDADWMRTIRKYATKGYKIQVSDTFELENCKCLD